MTWTYIAGFFDGEGSLIKKPNKKSYRIQIAQTNKKVLKEILEYVGCGHICHPKKRKPHWKESWMFYISKQEDVLKFLKKIADNLIVKRKQVNEFLPILEEQVLKKGVHQRKIITRKRRAKILRKQGLSYREIGKKLNIDWGYARRIIIK